MKTAMSRIGFRMLRSALDMFRDCRGIAATEFAVIVPVMLVMFFGTVEFSSGVAVDRKVTLVARTLSDLTSQTPISALKRPTDGDRQLFAKRLQRRRSDCTPYTPTTPLQGHDFGDCMIDPTDVAHGFNGARCDRHGYRAQR